MFERLPCHEVSPLDFDTFVRRPVIVIMTRFIVTRLPQNAAAAFAAGLPWPYQIYVYSTNGKRNEKSRQGREAQPRCTETEAVASACASVCVCVWVCVYATTLKMFWVIWRHKHKSVL